MRTLAVDYGTVRIGLAISDELGITAAPLRLLTYTRGTIDEIAGIVATERVGTVVVGVPYPMVGGESEMTHRARAFAGRLREKLTVPVEEWDEARSSQQASQRMVEAGVRRSRRRTKGENDMWAAAVILQEYLEAHR